MKWMEMKKNVSASQGSSFLPAPSGPVCPVLTLSETHAVHSESLVDSHRPPRPSPGLNSEGYLADGGHHIFVLLSAQKFLDAEVELVQQLFVGRQP